MKRAVVTSTVCGLALASTACVPSLAGEPGDSGSTQHTSSLPLTAQFGQRYSWTDGVAVTLSRPSPLHSPMVGPGRRGVQLTMTVNNGGPTPLRLPQAKLDGTFTERGTGKVVDAEPVVDKLGRIGINPDTPVLPAGRSIEVRIGFSVGEHAGTLLVAASPEANGKYQDVTFAGEV